MDKERRRRLARELGAKIRRERKDVRAILLFGSVARGDDMPYSDVEMKVVSRRGPWAPQRFVIDGTLFNVYWKSWPSLMRDMVEVAAGADGHGFLSAEPLYDPEHLLEKLRRMVAALPDAWYRECAAETLASMYEYVCKARNAWRRRDRANLVYGARVAAGEAAQVLALVNRRSFRSENAVFHAWREFPDVPRGFGRPFDGVVGGRLSDEDLHRSVQALWRVTRDWASRRGVRLATAKRLSSVRIPKSR